MSRFALVLLSIFIWCFATSTLAAGDPRTTEILERYRYNVEYNFGKMEQTNASKKACWVFDLEYTVNFPSSLEVPLKVQATLYMPNPKKADAKAFPTVVQLPPTGGVNILDKIMAKDFCSNEIAAIILKNDFANFDGSALPAVTDHMDSFQRTVAAIKGAQIFAEENNLLVAKKMGLFGVSIGSVFGSLAYSVEENLSAAYFLVGGGDIPFILAHSSDTRVSRLRALRMKQQGQTTVEEYEAYLRTFIDHDNTDLTPRVPAETVRMVISSKDTLVPTPQQYLLKMSLNDPEARISKRGHSGAVIESMLHCKSRTKIIDFFQNRFAQENPRWTAKGAFLKSLDVISKH